MSLPGLCDHLHRFLLELEYSEYKIELCFKFTLPIYLKKWLIIQINKLDHNIRSRDYGFGYDLGKSKQRKERNRVRTRDTGSAVDKDEDHAAKSPCNAKDANTATLITTSSSVALTLVANDSQDSDVQEQKGGDELGDESPVEGPLAQLLRIEQGRWRWVLIVLVYVSCLSNFHVLPHFLIISLLHFLALLASSRWRESE